MTHPEWGTKWSANAVPEEGPDHPEVQRRVRQRERRQRRRRNLRRVLFTVTLLLMAVIAGVAWVGVDALRARGELQAAAT